MIRHLGRAAKYQAHRTIPNWNNNHQNKRDQEIPKDKLTTLKRVHCWRSDGQDLSASLGW